MIISKRPNFSYYLYWIILVALIGFIQSIFRINDYIDIPQHGHFETFDAVSAVIKSSSRSTILAYYSYFIIELVFIALSLYIGARWIKTMDNKLVRVYNVGVVVVLILEFIENVLRYMIFEGDGLEILYFVKIGVYFFCSFFIIIYVFKNLVLKKYRTVARFIITSIVSLIFIAFIYGLLTLMPQGGTLVVSMLDSFWNTFGFFFLLIFLAIILAHYPTYAELWWYGSNNVWRLKMAYWKPRGDATCDSIMETGRKALKEKENPDKDLEQERVLSRQTIDELTTEEAGSFNFFGWGFIYYDTSQGTPEGKRLYNDETIKRWRRSLGILLYIAVFNIFFRVAAQYFEKDINVIGLTIFILIGSLVIYHFHGEMYNGWKISIAEALGNHKTGDQPPRPVKDVLKEIQDYCTFFPYFILISIGLSLITSLLAHFVGWSGITLVFAFITLAAHLYLYMYFKICRTYLKYVFFTNELCRRQASMFNPATAYLFEKHRVKKRKDGWLRTLIGNLSNNVAFIKIMSASGFFSLLVLLLVNISFDIAAYINPINVILLYIILIYAAVFIVFKHVLYYNRNKDILKVHFTRPLLIPIIALVILIVVSITSKEDSDLHELTLVPIEKKDTMSRITFLKRLQSSDRQSTGNNYFYIGSYGGGLKANLWNNLLLFELDSLSRKRFLHKTVAMSGVSGGAVGIGNYSALRYNAQGDPVKMRQAIEEIGQSNVLSYELALWLGADFFREPIPFNIFKGRDRSYYSMREHSRMVGMKKGLFNNVTYRDYWQDMYAYEKASFPILITNTTSTLGKQGVASSLKVPDSIFSGADNILDFEGVNRDKSLTYFGALSTTNRFPLFSPTAEVPSKGHYLDGGYFDNSGLLSVLELHDHFTFLAKENAAVKEMNPVFINIINSKNYYTAKKIKEWGVTREAKDPGVGQISAILETVISIDKFPRYVSAKIRNKKYILEEVFMPHKIHLSDVEAQFRGEVADPLDLLEKIKTHNDSIDMALKAYSKYNKKKWGVVEPPLARLLSTPAVRYQEAMVKHHPDVQFAIQRILDYLVDDNEVNIKDQNIMKTSGYRRTPNKKIMRQDTLSNQ
ncbi:hypothetical protein EAX61_00830 [Dokdonia sinensis]|uniref:PNPLA domain-containing protein n=1 Tax=Dokdonia sinensis TaxID=2479847 RepID=A0A3M0GI53_9FLAO|nr:hypothetical protein [Dokdonia sinensis]RMB63958.1 hypothetical protein EAX61_00830 [Dokdonia sinensis]